MLFTWYREHKDRVGEGRALYNLGNVYHAKGWKCIVLQHLKHGPTNDADPFLKV